jgi:ADP-heptose:LPS heptosyltransferase
VKTSAVEVSSSQKPSPNSPQKVAWIRVGALGDLLVGLASLVETHERFPQAKITVVGPKLWCEILSPQAFPWVEQIAVIERKGTTAQIFKPVQDEATQKQTWRPANSAKQPLREVLRTCQAVVNTHLDSYRYGFTAFAARVPVRFGSAPAPMAWLYTHCSPFFGKDPLVHERDAALMILDYADASGLKFFRTVERNRVNLSEWVGRSRLIQKWRKLGLPPGKSPDLEEAQRLTGREPGTYVLVNPTSSRREKAWPAENFRALLLKAKPTLEAAGLEALVVGSPQETDWLREVADREFRVVQPPSIQSLQDLLSGSRGLLTNTSSVQFIAAMTGTPVITLMGRAVPEVWGPLGPHDEIIRNELNLDPALDIFQQEEAAYRALALDQVLPSFLALPTRPRVTGGLCAKL